MKMTKFFSIMAVLLMANVSQADSVLLKNGDKISGTIAHICEKNIAIDTKYAGKVKIARTEVSTFESNNKLNYEFPNGDIITGTVHKSKKTGAVVLHNDKISNSKAIDISALKGAFSGNVADKYKLKMYGHLNGGLKIITGNTEEEGFNLDFKSVAESKQNRFTVAASYNYSESAGVEISDNAGINLKYDRFFSEDLYGFLNAGFYRDTIKTLDLRSSVGAGLGYRILNSDAQKLNAELGLNYVNEAYDVATNDKSYVAGRWAIDYTAAISDGVNFFHNHEGLVSLDDVEDVLINSKTGISFPLFAGLNGTLGVNVNWDNTPIAGNESTDTTYLFTVGYSW